MSSVVPGINITERSVSLAGSVFRQCRCQKMSQMVATVVLVILEVLGVALCSQETEQLEQLDLGLAAGNKLVVV